MHRSVVGAALWNNLAAVHSKGETAEASAAVLTSCKEVLQLQPTNVKALFRMAKVHLAKQDYAAAKGCMVQRCTLFVAFLFCLSGALQRCKSLIG